jgi:hypothetical protein
MLNLRFPSKRQPTQEPRSAEIPDNRFPRKNHQSSHDHHADQNRQGGTGPMTQGWTPAQGQCRTTSARRTWWSVAVLGLLVLIPGCRLAGIAAHNASFEVCLYFDELREEIDNNRSAKAAWRDVLRENPGQRYSVDYERGFKAGYAQALEDGCRACTGPSIPAYNCWRPHYGAAASCEAIREWLAGFQHGEAVARSARTEAPPYEFPPLGRAEPRTEWGLAAKDLVPRVTTGILIFGDIMVSPGL